jgi:RimJ/RimL family protein N-acetyltransferase
VIVRAAHPEEFGWLVERAECAITPGFRAIAAEDQGRIVGMVGFDGWTPNSVTMHVALDSPACLRSLLPEIFDYAFRQAGKGLALGIIPAGNERSVNLAKRVGFREAYRVRDGWSVGEDLIVLEMRREECRWIPQARKAA